MSKVWPRYNESQVKSFLLDNASSVFEMIIRVSETKMTDASRKKAERIRDAITADWLALSNMINDAEYHRWYEGGWVLFDEMFKAKNRLRKNILTLARMLSRHKNIRVSRIFGMHYLTL